MLSETMEDRALLENLLTDLHRTGRGDGLALQRLSRALQARIEQRKFQEVSALQGTSRGRGTLVEQTAWRGLTTAALATWLAVELRLPSWEIQHIGGAALLHNAGELCGTGCRERRSEADEVGRRVLLSSALAAGVTGCPVRTASVIREQCERLNGTGTPAGLLAGQLHIDSRTLAIACRWAELSGTTRWSEARHVLAIETRRGDWDETIAGKLLAAIAEIPEPGRQRVDGAEYHVPKARFTADETRRAGVETEQHSARRHVPVRRDGRSSLMAPHYGPAARNRSGRRALPRHE